MSPRRRKSPARRGERGGGPRRPEGRRRAAPAAPPAEAFEAEVLPGLAPFARAELRRHGAVVATPPGADEARADAVAFAWRGAWRDLERLRTVTAVDRVVTFGVPRPKALLGDAHFRAMIEAIDEVRGRAARAMRGFRLEAAGRDSPVMVRLREALAARLGLADDPDEGELRLRLRPAPGGAAEGGWRLGIRLTPRPLSARDWRVCNRPGGLNACVAAAAWRMLGHAPEQRVLNAMCGSGTLLIERAALGPAARLVGLDRDPEAIACADRNRLAAAGGEPGGRHRPGGPGGAAGAPPRDRAARTVRDVAPSDVAPRYVDVRDVDLGDVELRVGDATATGYDEGAFDVVVADPPWGDAVGGRGEVETLHPAFLREAARLLPAGGRLLVITHALRAFEAALDAAGADWTDEATVRVFHGGHRPALRLLRRRGAPR